MNDTTDEPRRDIPSPCIRNCCLDEYDICMGCLRSISEIIAWGNASEFEKRGILERCAERRRQRNLRRGK
ncbi:MAG: DUF1289 domain-containing protein [Gammaproteobacteria bacterium]|nr:DUF1289 domain-containing protein [Gammaproteobacteria bacterium]